MTFDPSGDFDPTPVTVAVAAIANVTPSPVTVATTTVPGTPTPVTVANPVPLARDRRTFDENGVVELDENDQPTLSEPHFPTP